MYIPKSFRVLSWSDIDRQKRPESIEISLNINIKKNQLQKVLQQRLRATPRSENVSAAQTRVLTAVTESDCRGRSLLQTNLSFKKKLIFEKVTMVIIFCECVLLLRPRIWTNASDLRAVGPKVRGGGSFETDLRRIANIHPAKNVDTNDCGRTKPKTGDTSEAPSKGLPLVFLLLQGHNCRQRPTPRV